MHFIIKYDLKLCNLSIEIRIFYVQQDNFKFSLKKIKISYQKFV